MLPHFIIFWAFLLLTCGYALWRGQRDERVAALVCLSATLATRVVISPIAVRYTGIETNLVAIDGAVLLAFLWIALRSQRFWPLWVAGLQLTNSLAHLMKIADAELMPRAYATAAAFWSYPILIILIVGTWRSHQRWSRERNADGGAIPA